MFSHGAKHKAASVTHFHSAYPLSASVHSRAIDVQLILASGGTRRRCCLTYHEFLAYWRLKSRYPRAGGGPSAPSLTDGSPARIRSLRSHATPSAAQSSAWSGKRAWTQPSAGIVLGAPCRRDTKDAVFIKGPLARIIRQRFRKGLSLACALFAPPPRPIYLRLCLYRSMEISYYSELSLASVHASCGSGCLLHQWVEEPICGWHFKNFEIFSPSRGAESFEIANGISSED